MEQYESFNRIYDATRDALLRWLLPRIRSSADTEDLRPSSPNMRSC